MTPDSPHTLAYFHSLAFPLLGKDDWLPSPRPSWETHNDDVFLTRGDYVRLYVRLCKEGRGVAAGTTLDWWCDEATVAERAALLEAILPPDELTDEWLTLAAVARGLAWWTGRGKKKLRPDSAKVKRLGLDDNGKPGRDRRISRCSVLEYCRSQGLDWNDAGDTRPQVVAEL